MIGRSSLIFLLLISSFQVQKVFCAKILALQFFGSKSHVITYVGLLDEMARRGHDITLLGPSKGLPQEKSIREIFTVDIESSMADEEDDPYLNKELNNVINPIRLFRDTLPKVCKAVYALPEVMALLNETFDLILILPMVNECALGLVHKLNAPVVLFSPASAPSFLVEKIGGFYPPSFVPNLLLGYTDEMTFTERMKNFGINAFVELIFRFYHEPIAEEIYRDALGQDIPSSREILANASIILSNGHFSLHRPKPNLPDVIDVGGIHSRPAKPLPKELEDFIEKGGKDGFILFSLGSIIKGSKMPLKKREIFLNVFAKLKQRVIWKWESESMDGLPENVKLVKWLPQQDLLGHKGVKLFMTHCGMGGTEEAIYHGVPLIGLPFFGDQDLNANEAKNHGIIVDLDWNTLTEEILLHAINEVLNNPKYQESVKRLSSIFKDQPDSPLQRGVYWMEYVIRHKGAPHLKSASRKLNTIQYHSIDVMAAYFVIIFGTSYLILYFFRFLVRKTCGSSKHIISPSESMKKRN